MKTILTRPFSSSSFSLSSGTTIISDSHSPLDFTGTEQLIQNNSGSVKPGIPSDSRHPFSIPNLNIKRNSARFVQIMAILREYAKQLPIPQDNILLQHLISGLFTALENRFRLSHLEFCDYTKLHLNWFKLFILSGSRKQGDIPDALWNNLMNAPFLLQGIVKYMTDTRDPVALHSLSLLFLSVLSTHKVLCVPVAPSLSSITSPFTGDENAITGIDIESALDNLGIDKDFVRSVHKQACVLHRPHVSLSAGPNGHATWSAHLDSYELVADVSLYSSLLLLMSTQGLTTLRSRIDNILGIFASVDVGSLEWTGGCHSKLHVLFEKGTKSRLIAIGDYFTQSALIPIHDTLASILKGIDNDGTYDQDKAFSKVLEFTRTKKEVYSLDLSKATDRLPILFQERVISVLFGSSELGKAWASVLTNRDFVTEHGHHVRYAVGQPMGFKSSFPMLALTHHIIVQEAARRAGLSGFRDYVILGDDIVIANSDVKDHYIHIIVNILGMEISLNKSVTCEGGDLIGAEFASRLALNGREITGLPVHSIVECVANPNVANALWDTLTKRGTITGDKLWEFLSVFLDERALIELMDLNDLPSEVSGLHIRFPASSDGPFVENNLFNEAGIKHQDLINFYYFVMLTEAISKLDTAAKKAVNLLNVVTHELQVRPDSEGSTLSGAKMSLSLLLRDLIGKTSAIQEYTHPIQDAVYSMATRIADLLSMFSSSHIDYKQLISGSQLDILKFDLNKKASYTESFSQLFADRRALDKALRLIKKTMVSKTAFDPISQVVSIPGATHMWIITVKVGSGLIVVPHVPKITTIAKGGKVRFDQALNKRAGRGAFGELVK